MGKESEWAFLPGNMGAYEMVRKGKKRVKEVAASVLKRDREKTTVTVRNRLLIHVHVN